MAPVWLTVLAWIYLSICFACAAAISYDIAVSRRRQPMAIMNLVYPITALYFGPVALAFYWRWARAAVAGTATSASMAAAAEPRPALAAAGDGTTMHGGRSAVDDAPSPAMATEGPEHADHSANGRGRPRWISMAMEVSHCGSGCALGDVISEFVIFALALAIAGTTLWAEYVGDYILALAFGIVFQYFAIAPMRGLGVRDGLKAAAKADTISLTFFEIGLFGWMAIMTFVLFPAPNLLMPDSAAFWFLMQIGMMIGFFTSWPANVWLVKRGIKVPM